MPTNLSYIYYIDFITVFPPFGVVSLAAVFDI